MIKSGMVRWAGYKALMGKMRSVHRNMVVNSTGKKSLVRPRYSWEDNNKMDLRESGFGGVEWIHLAQHKDQ
jgi:hypothetical protein